MDVFRVECDQITVADNECYRKWWDVTDGNRSYECSTEEEANELVLKLNAHDDLVAALKQLANCDLNDGNCASLAIASKRVRNIAKAALAKAEPTQC